MGPFFGGAFFGSGFFGRLVQGGGYLEVSSWQDHVKAVSDRRNAKIELAKEQKTLKHVEKQIKKVEKEIASNPEGILAKLYELEDRKVEVRKRIEIAKVKIDGLEKAIQAFQAEAENEDDDEDVLLLL